MKTVTMIRIDRDPSTPAGSMSTMAIGVGIDDDGNVLRFGIDWRAAQTISAALRDGEDVRAAVESWQILSSAPAFMVVQ